MNELIPEKDDRVDLLDYGPGKVLGVYAGNMFPIHVLFDSGQCETFTFIHFAELQTQGGRP